MLTVLVVIVTAGFAAVELTSFESGGARSYAVVKVLAIPKTEGDIQGHRWFCGAVMFNKTGVLTSLRCLYSPDVYQIKQKTTTIHTTQAPSEPPATTAAPVTSKR